MVKHMQQNTCIYTSNDNTVDNIYTELNSIDLLHPNISFSNQIFPVGGLDVNPLE